MIFFINSVLIRFVGLSIRRVILSIRSNDLSIQWSVPKHSESMIYDAYQFSINSVIFPRLPKNYRNEYDHMIQYLWWFLEYFTRKCHLLCDTLFAYNDIDDLHTCIKQAVVILIHTFHCKISLKGWPLNDSFLGIKLGVSLWRVDFSYLHYSIFID